jgi:hypothetical protein
MNERIKELVREAGLDDPDFPIEDWDNVPLSKFATLLIKECATLAFDGPNGILEHFGVEE